MLVIINFAPVYEIFWIGIEGSFINNGWNYKSIHYIIFRDNSY